jgi:L-threonylcarbamoyladenylate synthase
MSEGAGQREGLDRDDARRLRECIEAGGVAVLPTDTVYGLACDPRQPAAVERLYALKGRPAERPAAVMFFALAPALERLPELRERERDAAARLLPGPVTLLLPNRERRFALACAADPDTLGLRVPLLDPALAALAELELALLQSSANLSGRPPVRRVGDLPAALRDGADLVLDVGERGGTASTVVDLRALQARGEWSVVREGAFAIEALERALVLAS